MLATGSNRFQIYSRLEDEGIQKKTITLPETNSNVAPENEWLNIYSFPFGSKFGLFSWAELCCSLFSSRVFSICKSLQTKTALKSTLPKVSRYASELGEGFLGKFKMSRWVKVRINGSQMLNGDGLFTYIWVV